MRIAINGLGRIGRQVLRQAMARPELEVAALNDLGDPAVLAHLVAWDSVHGPAPFRVEAEGSALVLDGRRVPLFRDPAPGAFRDSGAGTVLECTGRHGTREAASAHLGGSVTRVLLSAPFEGDGPVVLPALAPHQPTPPPAASAGCPASQALALLLEVLDGAFGVEAALATAVESYGNDQRILDLPHADPRMARAASMSMIPAPTRAGECLAQARPWTAGRLEVSAVRVPTPDVSLVDLGVRLRRDADAAAVDAAFRAAVRPGLLEILEAQLVSVDLRGRRASAILDPWLTRVISPRFLKVYAWYDNEAAYAARLLDLCAEAPR